ncbi:hypothetical protein [Lactobacillus sp. ESL0681]|uniref:hypothetical protein n=1 Tax=Lactobacillus sp. ESL0681 TaxID=2983211 RepID=UPI0023F86563|nr:hypothetical protein [Lactobacillus sp. ESL0681]WEV40326.1 hypothetical protein OZX59_09180 [Lactobacillus sp. ESL0681]
MQGTIKINAKQAIKQLDIIISKAREANAEIEKLRKNVDAIKKEQSIDDHSQKEITNKKIECLAKSYFKEITTMPVYSAEDTKAVAELYKAIMN